MAGPAPLVLTTRDISIIAMVYAYGGCTADHIRRRFFPMSGSRSPCYTRIAKLVGAGYLASRRLPSVSGIGSGKAFLTIGPRARPVLAEVLGISRMDVARASRAMAPQVVEHHSAICHTRLSVVLAAERSPVFTLTEWIPEVELRRTPLKVTDAKDEDLVPIVPDGAFMLTLPDGTRGSFWLEQDMGTVPIKRMKTKLAVYLLLAAAAHSDARSPVLFVTTSPERQAAIAEWARSEAARRGLDPTVVWVTTRDRLNETTVLAAPIWQVAGGPSALALESLAGSDHVDRLPIADDSHTLVGGMSR